MKTKLRGRFPRSSPAERQLDQDRVKDATKGSRGLAQQPTFLRVSRIQGSELQHGKDGPRFPYLLTLSLSSLLSHFLWERRYIPKSHH